MLDREFMNGEEALPSIINIHTHAQSIIIQVRGIIYYTPTTSV